MATELHLSWDDDTIETVLDALADYASRFSMPTLPRRSRVERARALKARNDIEEAERLAVTGDAK
jgi:hypothetical protein